MRMEMEGMPLSPGLYDALMKVSDTSLNASVKGLVITVPYALSWN